MKKIIVQENVQIDNLLLESGDIVYLEAEDVDSLTIDDEQIPPIINGEDIQDIHVHYENFLIFANGERYYMKPAELLTIAKEAVKDKRFSIEKARTRTWLKLIND